MNLKENRRYDMLTRVHGFGKRRVRAFPPSTAGGQAFAELGDIIAELSEQDASRRSCEARLRTHTTDRVSARKALRASLLAIHRTALAIAIRAPNRPSKYRLPRTRGDGAWIRRLAHVPVAGRRGADTDAIAIAARHDHGAEDRFGHR